MQSTIFWNGKYHLSLLHDNVSQKLLQGSNDPSLELSVRGCIRGQTASRESPTLSPRWWCRWLFFTFLGEENTWDGFDCIIQNMNQRHRDPTRHDFDADVNRASMTIFPPVGPVLGPRHHSHPRDGAQMLSKGPQRKTRVRTDLYTQKVKFCNFCCFLNHIWP